MIKICLEFKHKITFDTVDHLLPTALSSIPNLDNAYNFKMLTYIFLELKFGSLFHQLKYTHCSEKIINQTKICK